MKTSFAIHPQLIRNRSLRPRPLLVVAGVLTACIPGLPGVPPTDSASTGTQADGTTTRGEPSSGQGPGMTSTSGTAGTISSTDPGNTTLMTSDSADESGGSFIVDPDGGVCSVHSPFLFCSLCDFWVEDCPTGDKCMPWANDEGTAWNSRRCSTIEPDPDAVDEPCTVEGGPVSGFDSCELHALCWGVDPEMLTGICVGMCNGTEDNPQCPEGTACMIANDGALNLCLPTCDPLQPTCDPGQTCHLVNDDFFCLPTQGGQVSDPTLSCGNDGLSCTTGDVCLSADLLAGCTQSTCCTALCDLSQPDPDAPCAADNPEHQCIPLSESGASPPEAETVGVCRQPPA